MKYGTAQAVKTWRFRYGLIALLFGAVGVFFVLSNRDKVVEEYKTVLKEEGCFAPTDAQKKEWKQMTNEQRRVRSERCMAARNRSSQMRFGPPVFFTIVAVGIFLVLFSFVPLRSRADRVLEQFAEEEQRGASPPE